MVAAIFRDWSLDDTPGRDLHEGQMPCRLRGSTSSVGAQEAHAQRCGAQVPTERPERVKSGRFEKGQLECPQFLPVPIEQGFQKSGRESKRDL